MRVLIVEPAGLLWGSERALLDFVTRMPGVEVAVCCPPKTPMCGELAKRNVPTFPYFIADLHRKSRWRRAHAAMGVARACRDFRPDIVHVNQAGAYRVVSTAARLLGLPLVAHVRLFEDVPYLAVRRPDPRRLRGIIAVSRAIAAEFGRHPALAVISQSTLYDCYVPIRTPAVVPARLPNRIACVGRIAPSKGQHLLVEAMKLCAADSPAECLVIGEGPDDYVRGLRETTGEGPAAGRIQWLGRRDDVPALLRTSKVLVCPSEQESFGRVILEAWNAGAVPIACRASGGAAEIIDAAGGGILYPEQTAEALAAALRSALDLPPSDAARLVANGRAWMAENCDADRHAASMAAILSAAAQDASP